MNWLALLAAVALGVWLGVVLVVLTLALLWSLHQRARRARSGDSLVDLLRRRNVID